ncbi:unnamed protein product, partial [Adineta ricciae]
TDYLLYIPSASVYASSSPWSYNSCNCASTSTCGYEAPIRRYPNQTVTFIVPGFYIGCYVIESLLKSNLKCFYNQKCITSLQFHFSGTIPFNATSLNSTSTTRYFQNSTIQDLLNYLMVEEWDTTENYTSYYADCRPSQCVYTYTARNDITYIVTTLIGLLGGLMTILRLLVPPTIKFIRKKCSFRRRSESDEPEQRSVGSLFTKLKLYIATFNMFPSIPPSTSNYVLQNQRISTRVFIILLATILVILSIYNSVGTITKAITVKTPTLEQYLHLYAAYPQTLTCPCTEISVEYAKFIEVYYSFHQVCTSDFIGKEWIRYVASSFTYTTVWRSDFRWTGASLFRALRTNCQLMNTTVSDNLERFYSEEYVNAFLSPPELFSSQIYALSEQFKTATISSRLLAISMMRDTTQANALYTTQLTNFNLQGENANNMIVSESVVYDDCRCDISSKCVLPSGIYDYRTYATQFMVPGVYYGCYVIESLLQSNLQCFYNQTCTNILTSYFSTNLRFNATALNSLLPSRYSVESTIQDLVNDLMMEEWRTVGNYTSYYAGCRPAQCVYTYTARNDIIYIVTVLIGLVGGLMTVLQLLVPRLVTFVRKACTFRRFNRDASGQYQSSVTVTKVKQYASAFNLFPSIPPADNAYDLQNQKISTRVYIILLAIILVFLLMYNSLRTLTETVTVKTPTLEQYSRLYSEYSETMTCPCTKISVKYEKLVEVHYSFHQVCRSHFVSEKWIDFLALYASTTKLNYDDFRWTAKYTFQALRAFCQLMNTTISDNLKRFYSEEYVSAFVTPPELLQSQVQGSVEQFKTATINSLLLSLSMIRETTHGNSLFSGLQINYYLYQTPDRELSPIVRNYGNCSCASSLTCGYQSAVRDYGSHRVKFSVPGFYVGCYVIESLLRSNLQCFYNQSCVSTLQSYFTGVLQFNATALDSSLTS